MRKLSHDAMPMPDHVPRTHHEATKVQEHAATAGLSKFHFHGFQRKELGLQLFLVRDSRSITTHDFIHADQSGIGWGPYVSSQAEGNFCL